MAEISVDTSGSSSDPETPLVMETQPTVEQEDRNFISKVVQFVQTLPNVDVERLKVQTNTTPPSRYVLLLKNLPQMDEKDFQTIVTLAPRLRGLWVSLKNNQIKIDIWKNGAKQRKIKRKHVQNSSRKWNLKGVNKKDTAMVERLLDGLANLPSMPCQFHVTIKSEPPNYYWIDVVSNDTISLEDVKDYKHDHRAFIKSISFNFPHSVIRLKVERATADTEAAVGRRTVVVYKKQIL